MQVKELMAFLNRCNPESYVIAIEKYEDIFAGDTGSEIESGIEAAAVSNENRLEPMVFLKF